MPQISLFYGIYILMNFADHINHHIFMRGMAITK